MCTKDKYDGNIDTNPFAFAQHRRRTWPHPAAPFTMAGGLGPYASIYDAVRSTGVPNCLGARIPIPTHLHVDVWRSYVDIDNDEADLLDYVQFGFPLGYLGPISPTDDIQNHPSAPRFPDHIHKFISTKKEAVALIGPFSHPPFIPWIHLSPLMSRPKAEPNKRRVITDLTFPTDRSVNAYIMKNSALGEVREHTLPSVAPTLYSLGWGLLHGCVYALWGQGFFLFHAACRKPHHSCSLRRGHRGQHVPGRRGGRRSRLRDSYSSV